MYQTQAPEQQEAQAPSVVMPTINQLQTWARTDLQAHNAWRPEAERLEGMIHAYQWTDEEKAGLEKQGRKAFRSPHSAKVIWSMVGWQAQNKSEIKYLPRGGSDEGIATARTQVAKYWWDANQAEYAQSDIRLQQYVGPLGWWHVCVQQDDPNREPVVIESIPWREMLWDASARKLDLSDAKRITRNRWVPLEEAIELYPEHEAYLRSMAQMVKSGMANTNEWGMEYIIERVGDAVGPVTSWDQTTFSGVQEVRLVQTISVHKRKGHYIELPDGRNVVFNPKNVEHQLGVMQGAMVRPGKVTTFVTSTFCGDQILEQMADPYGVPMFPFIPQWGLIDQRGIPYGITRLIEDEQTVINWSTSKLLWIAGSRQAFVSPEADMEGVAENLAKPDGLVPRRSPDEVQIIPQSDMAGLNANLYQNALNNIKEIAGSPDEMRGQESTAKSGVAIQARQSAALAQQGRFLDNERRALALVGQYLSALMDNGQVISTEKILRITEGNGKLSQVAVNVEDPMRREQLEQYGIKTYGAIAQGNYDCVVTTGPVSETERQAQSQNLTQMLSGMDPMVRLALLDLWVDSGDWQNKDEIVKRIQQIQQTQFGQPQGVDQGVPELEVPQSDQAMALEQQQAQQLQAQQAQYDMMQAQMQQAQQAYGYQA